MAPTNRNRVVLVLAAIVAAVGTIDAVVSREWDFLAVFALTLLLLVVLLAQLSGRRPPVTVRADLARWLRTRGDETGEPMEVLLDRAVASYRAVFAEDHGPSG